MKSGFALENAEWPAFLVNQTGSIFRANAAAIKLFGSIFEGDNALLSTIWSSENQQAAEQFLARWDRGLASIAAVRFQTKGGAASGLFPVLICSFSKDQQHYFIFQLLPESPANPNNKTPAVESKTPATASSPDSKSTGPDSAIAHKQKLDCALQLARTVSLDFNNALTSILGHTSLLLSQMEPNHPWRRSLLEVEKSASKAAEIASDLGAFSRQEKEPQRQASGNLNSIVQRSVELFQNTPAPTPKVQWSLQLGKKLFATKFDEAKMQQAFVKILENAVQSISTSGEISVQTRNVELQEPAQDRDLRLQAGTYVCVEFSDNGCGIAPDVLPRIFEPFFTTKKGANHRGLGLAWVYGIVTNHGGGVAVSSEQGVGTSARVYLPAEKKLVRDTAVSADELTGDQTILMVDDEDLLLTMGQTVLSAYGYTVLTANSGQKALEILGKNKKVDLMITDLVMPNMSGRELVEHVQKLSPQTRILCTSGFVAPANQNSDAAYLQKPFTSQDLLVKVKQTLAAAEATSVD